MKLITIATFENEITTLIVESKLREEGIQYRNFKNFTFKISWSDSFQKKGFEIQVLENDLDKAKEIVKLFE